jgi:hypothetical protein
LLDKIRGKNQEEVLFGPPEVEKKLKECKKVISFVWHSGDTFEPRFATLTSAILSEVTNGIYYSPEDDIWHENDNLVAQIFDEVLEYERSLSENEIEFIEFDEW